MSNHTAEKASIISFALTSVIMALVKEYKLPEQAAIDLAVRVFRDAMEMAAKEMDL